MTTSDFRVFVSAVSGEFGALRSAVASDLRTKDWSVRVQDDFRQEAGADTLLRKLHNYIRGCTVMVCIMGERSGACPTEAEAAPFRQFLPEGVTQASYTQWEFHLARGHGRRIVLFVAEGHSPEQPAAGADDADLQARFKRAIFDQGLDRESFATADELRRKVLRADWPYVRRPKPIVLPYSSIGALFKGREAFLGLLRERLGQGVPTAVVSHALYGLGGIGKTRAAVEYAWSQRADYTGLLFVVAETVETLRRNLASLAGTLVPKLDTTDDPVRLQAVLDWLQGNPGWLLILDNVDTPSALAEVEKLLGRLSGGHVLVTSRLANFSASFRAIEMDVLGLDDAAAFLLARTDGGRRRAGDDGAKARELAEMLGRLALALEQAAAQITKRRLTFADYLRAWSSSNDLLAWFDPTITGYPRSVAVTWQTSVDQLSERGRHLLARLAWLAPERVPEFLLDPPEPDAGNENLREALEDLAAYSLVTRDAEGPYFLIHRLVQDVTRRSLAGEERGARLTEALSWINAAFRGDEADAHNWPHLDPLAPHAQAVTGYADEAGISHPTALLMSALAMLLKAKGLYTEAEPLLQRARTLGEAAYDPDDSRMATILMRVAVMLLARGRLADAEPLMRRALAIDEQEFGPDSPNVAVDLNNLATLMQNRGKIAEAISLMRRALAIDENSSPPNPRRVALRLSNLGEAVKATGQFAEAEQLMGRALDLFEQNNGADHPTVATCLGNLSTILYHTKRFDGAERLVRRAIAIDEATLGPDHTDLALRLEILGQILVSKNQTVEAEPIMRRSLAINEKAYKTDHSSIVNSLLHLADLISVQRPSQADTLRRRAKAMMLRMRARSPGSRP